MGLEVTQLRLIQHQANLIPLLQEAGQMDPMVILNQNRMIKSKKIILTGGFIAVLCFITWHELEHPVYRYIHDQLLNTEHENYESRSYIWHTYIEKQFKFLDFKTPKNVGYISNLGKYLSGSLIFFGLARQEKNRAVKYLGFGSISIFSGILFFDYGYNWLLELMDKRLDINFFDNWFKTSVVIRILNIGILLCFILFLTKRLQK